MTLKSCLSLVLATLCGLAAAAVVLGFMNGLHPAFDSLSHFRLHLAAGLATGGLILAATRLRRGGLAAVAIAAICVAATPGTWPNALGPRAIAAPVPEDRATYRLLHLNARFDNAEPERFLSLIAGLRPDVVTINEVSAQWRRRLETLGAAYPHRVVCATRRKVGGVAILSRRPFTPGTAPECVDDGTLAIASVDFSGRQVTVAATHLHWPWPFEQPDQVERLAERLRTLPDAAILTGDFNAARWSRSVRSLAEAARMEDAGPVGPTWLPRRMPDAIRRVAGLGIDHVLAGRDVAVTSVERTVDGGSDHIPVLVRFWLPFEAIPEPAGSGLAQRSPEAVSSSPGA